MSVLGPFCTSSSIGYSQLFLLVNRNRECSTAVIDFKLNWLQIVKGIINQGVWIILFKNNENAKVKWRINGCGVLGWGLGGTYPGAPGEKGRKSLVAYPSTFCFRGCPPLLFFKKKQSRGAACRGSFESLGWKPEVMRDGEAGCGLSSPQNMPGSRCKVKHLQIRGSTPESVSSGAGPPGTPLINGPVLTLASPNCSDTDTGPIEHIWVPWYDGPVTNKIISRLGGGHKALHESVSILHLHKSANTAVPNLGTHHFNISIKGPGTSTRHCVISS